MRIALLLVLLSGCVVLPSSNKTSRHLGFEPSPDVRKGLSRGLTLKTSVAHGDLVVSAIRTRDCHREVFDVIEVTERRGLRMGGVEDPRGRAFGAMLAPVTLPISLVISSIAVAANHESSHVIRAAHHVETSACTEPAANIAIDIELASGQHVVERTDAIGNVVVTIPAAEPAHGVVVVRAEAQIAQLKYRRKSPLAMRPADSLGE